MAGDAARTDVLRAAGIETARAVIVGPNRDDAAVLITLTLIEKPVSKEQSGRPLAEFGRGKLALAVIRNDDLLRFDDPRAEHLEEGDRVICLCNQDAPGLLKGPATEAERSISQPGAPRLKTAIPAVE